MVAQCAQSLFRRQEGGGGTALSLSFSPLAVSYRPGPERAARALNPLYVSRAPSSPRPAPRASVASVAAAAALRSSHLARLADCLKEIKSESGRARRTWREGRGRGNRSRCRRGRLARSSLSPPRRRVRSSPLLFTSTPPELRPRVRPTTSELLLCSQTSGQASDRERESGESRPAARARRAVVVAVAAVLSSDEQRRRREEEAAAAVARAP